MFSTNQYHAIIRKSIAVFGALFNDIVISRNDGNGISAQSFKIPISYGPREKFLARVESDAELNRPQSISLPRISFELKSLQYATDRKISSSQQRSFSTANTSIYKTLYADVPYDLKFVVSIMVKEAEDGTKIIEQILPHFTPDHTLSVKMIDEFPSLITDIPITLDGISSEDTYSGSFETRRALIWELNFTMRVKLYGPVFKKKIIKIVEIRSYSETNSEQVIEKITITPGLDANSNPTSVANNSISPILILEEDNYGYVITIEDFPDV